jgi:hypothetical protein
MHTRLAAGDGWHSIHDCFERGVVGSHNTSYSAPLMSADVDVGNALAAMARGPLIRWCLLLSREGCGG